MYPPCRHTPDRPSLGWLGLLAAGVLLAALPRPATAYERTKTCSSFGTTECEPGQTPKPLKWPVRCVRYRVHEAGSADFPSDQKGRIGEELRDLVRRAFETWNAPNCTDFTLVEGRLTSKSAGYDEEAGLQGNTNVVMWRNDTWPYESMNAAFALTSVSYKENGWIEDADIELNSATYDLTHFSESKTDEMTAKVDLLNTLTHEIGHFVGLAHSEKPKATMFGVAPLGEIRKRTLHRDDIAGLCAAYPGDPRDGSCDAPEDFRRPTTAREQTETEPTCSMTRRRPTPGFLAAAGLSLIALAGRFRRRD